MPNVPPTHAEPPRGVNHVVLNVRSLEASHAFWTDIMGFRCVAEVKPVFCIGMVPESGDGGQNTPGRKMVGH